MQQSVRQVVILDYTIQGDWPDVFMTAFIQAGRDYIDRLVESVTTGFFKVMLEGSMKKIGPL